MKNKQRLINGKAMLQRVDAEATDHVMASLDRVAPDVAKLILEFAFNDIIHVLVYCCNNANLLLLLVY